MISIDFKKPVTGFYWFFTRKIKTHYFFVFSKNSKKLVHWFFEPRLLEVKNQKYPNNLFVINAFYLHCIVLFEWAYKAEAYDPCGASSISIAFIPASELVNFVTQKWEFCSWWSFDLFCFAMSSFILVGVYTQRSTMDFVYLHWHLILSNTL